MTNIYIEKLDTSNPPNTIAVYTITNNQSFEPDYDAPVSPFPLPQNADTQNILIKMEGNSSTIKETWIMNKKSSSLPNVITAYSGYIASVASDLSANPLTAFDQVIFFKKFILPTQITDAYRITIADNLILGGSISGNTFTPSTTTINGVKVFSSISFVSNDASNGQFYYQEYGTITGLRPVMSGDSPVSFTSTLDFQVGSVVSAWNLNAPTAPQNVTLTAGSAGSHSITISWSAPSDTAGGVTNYKIYRRTWNDSQTLVTTVGSGTTSYVDSNTTSSLVYYYIVVATNNKGLGISSIEDYITSP